VQNVGTQATPGPVTLVDTLPPELEFVSVSSLSFTCSNVGREVRCSYAGALSALSGLSGIGIVARATTSEAWDEAHRRFPDDRRGQITHQLAMKVSDSQWHRQLSSVGSDAAPEDPYWLGPFENSHTFCPYLVGSYDTVADAVARYVNVGFRTFILDIPPSEAELAHIAVVFREAVGS
jgi:alkanesulfonate monooxygenase SsuD/methylene tetrahydromethanopterin reductase-like flavin-dependent oxidoreductase (luciferase family)